MSHMIDEKVDTVYVPAGEQGKTWHGLETVAEGGTILADGSNVSLAFNPIIECGLKPEIDLDLTAMTEETRKAFEESMKDWKLLTADCRGGKAQNFIPLHVPKRGYRVHQNRSLFDCQVAAAKEVLGENGFEIVTIGTLGAYSQFFTSLVIKDKKEMTIGKLADNTNDVWRLFFNMNSSHNGLIGSHLSLSTIRQVCWNTVNMSIGQAEEEGTISTIKHTQNSECLITPAVFAKSLETWMTQKDQLKTFLESLQKETMTDDQFRYFAAGLFTNESTDELTVNSYNRIDDLTGLFHKGDGNQGKTRYDGLNAITQFFTSGDGVGNPDRVSKSKRIASASYGRGNDWKLEAIRVLGDPKEFKTFCTRGKKLYTDKVRVIASEEKLLKEATEAGKEAAKKAREAVLAGKN